MKIKYYVIHVKGKTEREKHINDVLNKYNIDAEFILDGNIEDLTDKVLDKYTTGGLHQKIAMTSCSIKHIYAYENFSKDSSDYSMIFEDDIVLSSNFHEILNKSILELKDKSNFLISYENSTHSFVSKSEKEVGKYLYKKEKGRCAGAYLIDKKAVFTMLDFIEKKKMPVIIDWFHNLLSSNGEIDIYWCDPAIAMQGSHNGQVASLIDNKKTGILRLLTYKFRGFWKSIAAKYK